MLGFSGSKLLFAKVYIFVGVKLTCSIFKEYFEIILSWGSQLGIGTWKGGLIPSFSFCKRRLKLKQTVLEPRREEFHTLLFSHEFSGKLYTFRHPKVSAY